MSLSITPLQLQVRKVDRGRGRPPSRVEMRQWLVPLRGRWEFRRWDLMILMRGFSMMTAEPRMGESDSETQSESSETQRNKSWSARDDHGAAGAISWSNLLVAMVK